MANPVSSILSFPSASPGPDSAGFVLQRGVRYIGRVDTDGPAVWEAICMSLGVDSAAWNADDLQGILSLFIMTLPTADPLVKGVLWNNSGIVTMSSGIDSEEGI